MTPDTSVQPRNVTLTLARMVWDQRWAIGVSISAALAVALTVIVRGADLLPGELASAHWMNNHSGGLGKAVATVLDVAVDATLAPILFGLLVPVVWWAWGRYAVVTYFLVGALTAPISLMELAHRPRPMDDLTFSDVVLGDGGYPSGHTLYAVLVFGIIAYLAARYGTPSRRRTALVWAILAVVVLMGPSRVVNVSHWPADVVASYLIGIALILSTIWLHERMLPWLDRHIPFVYSLLTGDGRATR